MYLPHTGRHIKPQEILARLVRRCSVRVSGRWNEQLAKMAEAALASGSPDKNPIVPDKPQIEKLYHQIWDEGMQRGTAAAS